MAMFDSFRNVGRRGRRLGIELGREVAVAEVRGDGQVGAVARTANPGVSGDELGRWLKRWLHSEGITAAPASLVITDGDVHHYLVDMPPMSDAERYLAAGAELRKLSPVPASQLVYGHVEVGAIDDRGTPKQRVLVSAIDKGTMRQATEAIEAAGLSVASVTTVPTALAHHLRAQPAAGGNAIAYLASGRCYLVVAQDGVVELVRDFTLRGAAGQEPGEVARAAAAELRRSFLFFGQRAQGATVDRLTLTGTLPRMGELARELREALGVPVDVFASDSLALDDAPRFAATLGAVSVGSAAGGSLVPPEQKAEQRVGRLMSVGRLVAGLVILVLVGWALTSFIGSSLQQRRLDELQRRLADRRVELEQARSRAVMRGEHFARRALLEERSYESMMLGALLQRVARSVPEQVTLQSVQLLPLLGPTGMTYWDARLDGLVLGTTRSESQSVFNRFYSLLDADPIVHHVSLVEPLVIGNLEARTLSPITSAAREGGGADRARTQPPASRARPGELRLTTSLDDLPPFAATETSVGFKLLVQLKAVESGGSR